MEPSSKARVGAKDFFLWLGAMVALYVSVISLTLLFHQYVNVWFPDAKLEPYGTYASGGIRLAIAFLIVFFPLYVFLTRVLHQDLRKNPDKKDLWVRRWLIFLTLFVAGIAMAIDLVIVLNTFLNGELTLRFGLKAFSIFAIVGTAFWYYLNELKGAWEADENKSKLVAGIVSVLVIASVVGSFAIIGSPVAERLYRIDDQKVNDLSVIQSQIFSYWHAKRVLPKILEEVKDPIAGAYIPNDADTGEAYEYRPTGELTFELCATFNRATRPLPSGVSRPVYPYGEGDWEHEAGRACFERTIDPERYPPAAKVPPPESF